ncbi:MAG: alpha-galactosidase [Halieaceae bacterium]|jgi:alpha-galactosidase
MEQRRLDSPSCTLVLSIDGGRAAVSYLGARLPDALPLEELAALGEAATPHGELDVSFADLLFPTYDGLPQDSPALLSSRDGQRQIVALVASFAAASQESLTLLMRDERAGIELSLRIDSTESGPLRWAPTLRNSGDTVLWVDWLASICVPLRLQPAEWQRMHGFWANEFQSVREPLGPSTLSMQSRRGRSSHQSWPGVVAGRCGFANQSGEVLSIALEWSGNHRIESALTSTGAHQLQGGIALQPGELQLTPNECYSPAAALLSYSKQGLNGLRRQTRRYWQARKGPLRRPIHFNSWEACYFNHDAERVLALMDSAAALGAERFVLDDGWMQGRSEAGLGLGDWRCCSHRYPEGLAPLAQRARELDMEFGLWVEPEMATADSQLALEHPQWLIGNPAFRPVSGRGQYLLNLTLPAVRQYILACLDRLVAEASPDYIKWDMNRDLAQIGAESQSSFLAMTQGFYALAESFRRRHPSVQLEVCAAGGARADAGSYHYADRLWPSDSMDPLQRFRVLGNASVFLPPRALGSHVGSVQSATSGASSSLSTRCIVALLGHMGLELDPAALDREERSTLRRWTDFFLEERDWLGTADYHFLDDVGAGSEAVLLMDESAERALLLALQSAYPVSAQSGFAKLPASLRGHRYRIVLRNPQDSGFAQKLPAWHSGEPIHACGDMLHELGLRLPLLRMGECALISLERED